ncbi:MAG: CDP-diacylglycerol--glycerol-3-phosphate 3-phosphatidyltransferase [Pseudomonadota bacterium]
MMWTTPNILTTARAAAVVPLVALCFVQAPLAHWAAFGVFIAAALTDYFDGKLARAWGQTSEFGRFLDPIADKLLIGAALLALTANGAILGVDVVAAILILCREIFVSGLREHLGGRNVVIPVSALAKWKTAAQMAAIGFLLVDDAAPAGWPVGDIGSILLWLAAAATVATGVDYFRGALPHLRGEARSAPPDAAGQRPSEPAEAA